MSIRKPSNHRLTREIQPMPDFVSAALLERGLMPRYDARPAYQRNDYLLWITSAKREQTRQRRLAQMLDELASGRLYMRMPWNP